MSGAAATFTERDFYLAEFRGRSIGIVLPAELPADITPLDSVLKGLADNDTRVVFFAASADLLERVARCGVDPNSDPTWTGTLWRQLATESRAGVRLAMEGFGHQCRDAAIRLQLAKLVWLDERGALMDAAGERISAVALTDLESRSSRLSTPALIPLDEIRAMLEGGVHSVSLCRLEELDDELFTYVGAGTFFTRERYADVRPLSLDDFDAAAYMLARGVAEGYLAPRSASEIEALLSFGFGVFIEGRYLAGIGALRPYPEEGVGEIAGLYTVTRFVGEGVGGHLIRFALSWAREQGLSRVFACTTSERVEGFFARLGFERIADEAIPATKWESYPEDRRTRVLCLGRRIA